jgi:molybdate transport system permease protein
VNGTPVDWLPITLLTLRVATVATLLSLAPAVALGYLLARRRFAGEGLVRAVVALPMVLPPVAVGLGLLLLLGRHGPLGGLLEALGVEIVFTWWAAVLAASVVGFPLLVRACEQSFGEVDVRFERVARSLGLGRLRTFFRVTLPLARRGVLYGSLLAFTRALGEFGATAVVAGNWPGHTETLALGIYSRVQLGDDRAALVLCAASFALALGALWIGETWLRRAGGRARFDRSTP